MALKNMGLVQLPKATDDPTKKKFAGVTQPGQAPLTPGMTQGQAAEYDAMDAKLGNYNAAMYQPGSLINPNSNIGPLPAIANRPGAIPAPAAPSAGAIPNLMGGQSLADMYGITYDQDAILGKFNDATKAQYDVLDKQYTATENKFYGNMFGNQQAGLDAVRKSNAAAVANGASRGMQAANELSSILNNQQLGADEATQLAVDRNLLNDKEQAAMAQNSLNALTTSNAAGMGLGNLDVTKYGADTQLNIGGMDLQARLDQNAKNLQVGELQSNATTTAARLGKEATLGAAQTNKEASAEAALKSYLSAIEVANTNKAASDVASQRSLEGQQLIANNTAKQPAAEETLQNIKNAVANNDMQSYVAYMSLFSVPAETAMKQFKEERGLLEDAEKQAKKEAEKNNKVTRSTLPDYINLSPALAKYYDSNGNYIGPKFKGESTISAG